MKTTRFLQLIFVLIVALSCSKSAKDFNSDFSQFKAYILNFSSGLVSANSDIRVVLAFDKKEWTANEELDENLFTISPSVNGKVVALSNNTIAFIPEKKLEEKLTIQYGITESLKEKSIEEINKYFDKQDRDLLDKDLNFLLHYFNEKNDDKLIKNIIRNMK